MVASEHAVRNHGLRAGAIFAWLAAVLLLPSGSARAQAAAHEALKYVAIGGGSTPESSEISLEQNLALAARVLTGPGALYFAGGRGSQSVRVEDGSAVESLIVRVGDLFNPRSGRRSRYRPTELPAQAATLESIESGLITALRSGSQPLFLYVSAHGQQGERPQANSIALWGGQSLSVTRLAQLHDANPRPLRVLAASCFSGGFGELAFKGADSGLGVTSAPRCGLFAGTWDRETSGCDPDPDRRNQEGYSLHVLQALHGRDRDGKALPPASLDLDHDGRVSLLEAHARASIAGQSIDVPTTTSERYLRSVQFSAGGAPDRTLVPEYAAVIDALGAQTSLPTRRAVQVRAAQLDRELDEVSDRFDEADGELQLAYSALAGRLLARWPVLDDAYHPSFAATLARDAAAIASALDEWPEAQRYEAAQRSVDKIDAVRQNLELEEARVARLSRAHETLALASGLRRRGGLRWAAYQRLLSCERFVPASQP